MIRANAREILTKVWKKYFKSSSDTWGFRVTKVLFQLSCSFCIKFYTFVSCDKDHIKVACTTKNRIS